MSESPQLTPAPVTKRPWWRLHRSTWVLTLLPAAVVLLLNVPGEVTGQRTVFWDNPSLEYFSEASSEDFSVVHGFPAVYLRRALPSGVDPGDDLPATVVWQLTNDVYELRVGVLLLNVVVGAIFLAIFAAAVEWRRRRRKRFLQFTLFEVLATFAVVGAFMAWWTHERASDLELRDNLEKVGNGDRIVSRFPQWLRSWVGDEALLPLHFNRPVFSIQDWNEETHEPIKYLIGKYPDAAPLMVNLFGNSDDDPAEMQKTFRKLGELVGVRHLHVNQRAFGEWVFHCPNLRTLVVEAANPLTTGRYGEFKLKNDPLLNRLKELPNLATFELWGFDATDRELEAITGAASITGITAGGLGITDVWIESLSRLPHLKWLTLEVSSIDDKGLKRLSDIKTLESLSLVGSQVTDAGLGYLIPLRNLKVVQLDGTKVTSAGAEVLRGERPDLKVTCEQDAVTITHGLIIKTPQHK